jgi:hypothetical protein
MQMIQHKTIQHFGTNHPHLPHYHYPAKNVFGLLGHILKALIFSNEGLSKLFKIDKRMFPFKISHSSPFLPFCK